VTNNHIKQLVSKGDRVMIFGGYGKRVPSEVGLKWKDLIGEVGSPGLGIPALMHHLLYEVDTTGVESMDNRTEILGDIIEASQSRQDDIIDEILFAMSDYPDLEVLPSGVMQTLIERTTYKGSWMSLRKTTTRITTPFRNEGVKINNIKIRFCVLKNHDFWKTCDDQKEYEKQYKLALPLINSQKF
jgi:hypothetical protein